MIVSGQDFIAGFDQLVAAVFGKHTDVCLRFRKPGDVLQPAIRIPSAHDPAAPDFIEYLVGNDTAVPEFAVGKGAFRAKAVFVYTDITVTARIARTHVKVGFKLLFVVHITGISEYGSAAAVRTDRRADLAAFFHVLFHGKHLAYAELMRIDYLKL